MKVVEDQCRPPLKLGLMALLVGGSAAFVAAMMIVLVVFALVSARDAAIAPLRQSTGLLVESLGGRMQDYLRAASAQGDFIASLLVEPLSGRAGLDEVTETLVAALASAPQMSAVFFIRPDLTGVRVSNRAGGAAAVSIVDLNNRSRAQKALRSAMSNTESGWGAPLILDTDSPGTSLNYRVPVRAQDRSEPLGLIVVTLRSDRLAAFMQSMALPPIRATFVLYGDDRILTRSGVGRLATDLSRLADVNDPALRALASSAASDTFFGEGLGDALLTVREVGGRDVLFLVRDLSGFAPERLRVGAYVDLSDIGLSTGRLWTIGLIGLSIVVAAALVAAWLAHRLAAPIRDLAIMANAMARLELDDVHEPKHSRIRELDDLARSFGAMLRAIGAFATYVPRQLVHQRLTLGEVGQMASEQRELTVMFTDLTGFSRMAESRSAPETARMLNEHFSRLTACVVAEGGTVDKFLGDALMAFWGAPERQTDHAARAVRAGVAMGRAFDDDPRRGVLGSGLRIGLHTGAVVVGDIGTAERMNYTIVGDPVNVAARLVELGRDHAVPSGTVILLSATTVLAAGAGAQVEDLGDHPIRGRSQTERVYRLLAEQVDASSG